MIGTLIASLTPKEKLALRIAGGLVVIGVVVGSIRWIGNNTMLVPGTGGTYAEGFTGQPTNVNPILPGGNAIDRDLAALLYSDLKSLAESIKPSPDSRVWEITLPADARWSDGEPLTSEDVLYTIETIQDPRTNSPYTQTWKGVVIERVSEHGVRITLKTPYAFLTDNLRELRIIPQHIFGAIPNANLRLSAYNLEAIGSGPYAFANFEKRKDGFIAAYALVANPRYKGHAPYIKSMVAKFFTDSRELIRAWNRNEIDGFGGRGNTVVKELTADYVNNDLALPQYYAIFENQGVNLALKNEVVRKALRTATNRALMIQTLFDGHGIAVHGPLLPNIEGYNAALYTEDIFSTDAASASLETDGWKIGSDGVREKPLGKKMVRLELELLVPQIQFLVDTATILKEDWAKIGAKVIVIPVPPEELVDSAVKPRNYQLLLFGNTLKNNPDIFEFWHSSERFYLGANLSVYDNRKVDALLETLRRTTEAAVRAPLIAKIQEAIWNDAPAIFLFSPNYRYILSPQLKGFRTEGLVTPSDRFRFVNEWYLSTKRVFK